MTALKESPKSTEVFTALYMFTSEEKRRLLAVLREIPTVPQREHLFHFNLTGKGVKVLAYEGRNHLVHHVDAVPEIKGALYVFGSKKDLKRFTMFWPGELGSHLQIFMALKNVFPDIVYLDKFPFQLDTVDASGTPQYSDSALKEISDWLQYDSIPH